MYVQTSELSFNIGFLIIRPNGHLVKNGCTKLGGRDARMLQP